MKQKIESLEDSLNKIADNNLRNEIQKVLDPVWALCKKHGNLYDLPNEGRAKLVFSHGGHGDITNLALPNLLASLPDFIFTVLCEAERSAHRSEFIQRVTDVHNMVNEQ